MSEDANAYDAQPVTEPAAKETRKRRMAVKNTRAMPISIAGVSYSKDEECELSSDQQKDKLLMSKVQRMLDLGVLVKC